MASETGANSAEGAAPAGPVQAQAAEPAEVTGFAHMLIKVADLARSQHFYVDLIGFTVRPAKPLPDGRPFVPFHQGIALTSGGPGTPSQIDHIAFKARGVRAIAERLRRADVKFFRELHDGIYGLTIYVADPDGNMIELFEEDAKLG
jgi:catechol 2,3-dioxygenase-like lactoylglutathione lyase family enzyme